MSCQNCTKINEHNATENDLAKFIEIKLNIVWDDRNAKDGLF